jgi:hypothetical protein
MSRIFRLLGLPLFLSGALVYPMQPANFNKAVGQPVHTLYSIDQLKELYNNILVFVENKTDDQVVYATMNTVKNIIDVLSSYKIDESVSRSLCVAYGYSAQNLKSMADQENCPKRFKDLSDQILIVLEKVLIERKVISPSPIESFYPRTNWSKVVGAERKGLKVSTQQSPESSESSWSPLSSDLSPVVQVALSLSSSNQSSNSSTPVETPRQKSNHFIPINVNATPATPTNSGRGSVTHCENHLGYGYDFWKPAPTTSTISSLCVERDERYPGYVN